AFLLDDGGTRQCRERNCQCSSRQNAGAMPLAQEASDSLHQSLRIRHVQTRKQATAALSAGPVTGEVGEEFAGLNLPAAASGTCPGVSKLKRKLERRGSIAQSPGLPQDEITVAKTCRFPAISSSTLQKSGSRSGFPQFRQRNLSSQMVHKNIPR